MGKSRPILAALCVGLAAALPAGNSLAHSSLTRALPAVRVASRVNPLGARLPGAIAVASGVVWIAYPNSNAVLEMRARAKAPYAIRALTSSQYKFDDPSAMLLVNSRLWVANAASNSVTVINASTGSLETVLSGASYGFNAPSALALSATHVWVANAAGNSISVIDGTTESISGGERSTSIARSGLG